MKKIAMYFSCLLLSALFANAVYAQTPSTQDDQSPKSLTDKTVSDRLNKDWTTRNTSLQGQPVLWYQLGEGYYGTYRNGDIQYMTFYDKDGNYVQTYKKRDWNSAPTAFKSSYDASVYKGRQVTSYWESSDPAKKGSYLELRDDQGKVSRIWADEKGQFSAAFPKGKPVY